MADHNQGIVANIGRDGCGRHIQHRVRDTKVIEIGLDIAGKVVVGAARLVDQHNRVGAMGAGWTLSQSQIALQSACDQANDQQDEQMQTGLWGAGALHLQRRTCHEQRTSSKEQ